MFGLSCEISTITIEPLSALRTSSAPSTDWTLPSTRAHCLRSPDGPVAFGGALGATGGGATAGTGGDGAVAGGDTTTVGAAAGATGAVTLGAEGGAAAGHWAVRGGRGRARAPARPRAGAGRGGR